MRPFARSFSALLVRTAVVAGVLLLMIGLLVTVNADAETDSPSPSPSSGGTTYRVGTLEYVDSLNPFIGYSMVDNVIYHLCYDYLTGYDPERLEPRPEFAESWSHSPDGKTWTFKIRPGMKWSDGAPATAHDVAFTFNYIMENQLASFTFFTSSIRKVTAPDDATVVFTCSSPKADILAMPVPILPEHVWSKVSLKAAESTFSNDPPIVGSGPYMVVESRHNDFTRLVPNEDYWRGAPRVDNLIFVTYTNADTMVQDLRSGILQGAVGVPPASFETLESKSLSTASATAWGFTQLSFNCYEDTASKGNPVLRDPEFRRAIQYAVDREAVATLAFHGHMSPGSTLVPPYSEYHWEPSADLEYTFDPERAASMLEAAGYRDIDGDGFRETRQGRPLSLRLYVATEIAADIAAAKLVTGWLNDIGLKVRLETLDPGALVSNIWNYEGGAFAPDFDMMLYYWTFYYDPQTVLSLLTPDQIGAWSDTSWTDPAYTKLFTRQSRELDRAKRITQVQRLQQIAHSASPYVILGYQQQLEAYDSVHWAGYVPAPSGFEGHEGAVLQNPQQVDTYIGLHPVSEEATGDSGPVRVGVWVGVAVAAVTVFAVLVWSLRRRPKSEVEA